MKIETEVLNEFLKAVKMTGDSELKEVVWNFTDSGLQIKGMCDSQTTFSSGLLKKEVFKNYEAIGKIGIQEMDKIIKILEGFNEPDIKVENNLLRVKEGNKIFETELLNIEFINNVSDINLNYDENSQNIPFMLSELKKFISDISINGKQNTTLIVVTDKNKKQLTLKNDGKYKFIRSYNMDQVVNDVELHFGIQFFDAIDNLVTEQINLVLKDKFPAKIVSMNDKYIVSIIVAPRVSEE